jgi:hypothetical protein
MKQRITPDDLKSLSPEQQEKLRTWWGEHRQKGDVFICLGNDFLSGKEFIWDGHNKPFSHSIPLISIGQLIELLMDKKAYHLWLSQGEYYNFGHNVIMDWDSKTELIDCLFQAVKEIL